MGEGVQRRGEGKFPKCPCLGSAAYPSREREVGLTFWLLLLGHRDTWIFILLLL